MSVAVSDCSGSRSSLPCPELRPAPLPEFSSPVPRPARRPLPPPPPQLLDCAAAAAFDSVFRYS